MPFFRAVPEKCFVCELERPHLGGCDALVINDLQSTQAADLLVQLGRFQAGKFRNRLPLDISGIGAVSGGGVPSPSPIFPPAMICQCSGCPSTPAKRRD